MSFFYFHLIKDEKTKSRTSTGGSHFVCIFQLEMPPVILARSSYRQSDVRSSVLHHSRNAAVVNSLTLFPELPTATLIQPQAEELLVVVLLPAASLTIS